MRPVDSRFALGLGSLALAVATAGCGSAHPSPRPPVRLSLTAPTDGTRTLADAVTVSGRVSPSSARVLVLGRPIGVRDGAFSTAVALAPGTTIIDVIAGAPRAEAAVAALRVTRYTLVTVPNVIGDSATQARSTLSADGLKTDVLGDRNPLRFLIPFSAKVCASSPPAKTRVMPGTTVTILVDKIC